MDQKWLSYHNIERLFIEFKHAYKDYFEEEFTGFRTGAIQDWEGYKPIIAIVAKERLGIEEWKPRDIGSGNILNSVISALKAKTLSGTSNNLVNWRFVDNLPSSIENKDNLRAFEETIYQFFKGLMPPERAFYHLTILAGKNYPFISYLFFIQDPERYLPIAPSYFDRVFKILGIEIRTRLNASWQNYQDYLSIIQTIQHYLIDNEYQDVRLIDAHSFCWLVSIFAKEKGNTHRFSESNIQLRVDIPFELLDDIAPFAPKPISSRDETSSVAPPDLAYFTEKNERNHFFGKLAEEVVLDFEKKRLNDAGRADLANKVEQISQRSMSAGYDIRSFEINDGRERLIEVKSSRGARNPLSFILSDNELRKSRTLENFYFYCVLFKDIKNGTITDRIIGIPSDKIDGSCFLPLTYRAIIRGNAD